MIRNGLGEGLGFREVGKFRVYKAKSSLKATIGNHV